MFETPVKPVESTFIYSLNNEHVNKIKTNQEQMTQHFNNVCFGVKLELKQINFTNIQPLVNIKKKN